MITPPAEGMIPSGQSCAECGTIVWKHRLGRPARFCGQPCADRFYAKIRELRLTARKFRDSAETCRRNAAVARFANEHNGFMADAAHYDEEADRLDYMAEFRANPTTRWEDLQ